MAGSTKRALFTPVSSNGKEPVMYLRPYFQLFPEQAVAETRSLAITRHATIPADEYALLESYCTDPGCDCRRVMIDVVGRTQVQRFLASISFAFDRTDSMPGPFLDPL